MDFHLGEETFGGNKKIPTVGEDRKEEGESKAVTEVGGNPRAIGGEASNRCKGCLGKSKAAGEVGGGSVVGDEPVPVPSEFRGGVKKLAVMSHRRRPVGSGGVPLHGCTPVYKLRLGNQEVNTPRVGDCPQTSEDALQDPGVRAIGGGGCSDRKIINV